MRAVARWVRFGRVPSAVLPPSSRARLVLERVSGVPAEVGLLPSSPRSFSRWWRRRANRMVDGANGSVVLFPTCLVERRVPAVGRDLVHVYERNGIGCVVPDVAVCCGRPFADDPHAARALGAVNVGSLATHVREGRDVVVPDPSCTAALRSYAARVGTDDARLVASRVREAAGPLADLARAGRLDRSFHGVVPVDVVLHVPPGADAADERAVLEATGASVAVVEGDAAAEADAAAYDAARADAEPLRRVLAGDDHDVAVGSCLLSDAALAAASGERVVHPVQLLARAYGIPEDT